MPVAIWRYDAGEDRGSRQRLTLPGVVARGFHGVTLLPLDEQVEDWLRLLGFSGRGVRIARVEPGQPASHAGLRRADVVTYVDGVEVKSVPQLRSKISSMLPGDVASASTSGATSRISAAVGPFPSTSG